MFCEIATSSTANDPDLNHTRRRLSVLSDNKLVDGVDSLNLDKTEEAPPSGNVSNRLITVSPSNINGFVGFIVDPLFLFLPLIIAVAVAGGSSYRWFHRQLIRRVFEERVCPV